MARRAILGLTAAVLGCSPGTSTVFTPDAAADVRLSADAENDVAPGEDVRPGVDSGPGPDMSRDMGTPSPDLPVGPSRVWTAETDGSIAWWTFDPATASLTRDGQIERGGNVNFLAFSSDRTRMYAANGDRVEAFDITVTPPMFIGDANAGVSGAATHLATDATNSHVFVAWYGGNAVSMLPLDANGAPSDASVVLGGAGDPGFCQRAHQIRVHPNNRFVYAPCLGSDHVAVLAYSGPAGTLVPQTPASAPAGSGPRHMDFHPTLPAAYVIGELDDTITRFSVDAATGALTLQDGVSTRPNPGDPLGPASDVHVSPDGNWLVGINRNPRDEVVSFALDGTGAMSEPRWVATGGEHARTFAFAPRGRHLLVGNSNSMDLSVFSFDAGVATRLETLGGFDARLFFVGFE